MEKYQTLKELCELQGPAGGEEELSAYLLDKLREKVDEIESDCLGNVFAVKKSTNPLAETVMLDAHMDEIAAMVTGITDEGFLQMTSISGMDSRVMLAAEVIIHGKEKVYGIVASRPPHLTTAEERKHSPEVKELVIDTGFPKEEVEKKAAPGDLITLHGSFHELGQHAFCSKALDNRSGVAILLRILDELWEEELPFHLAFLFSTQEEVGLRGARTGAYTLKPSECLVVDVTFGETPDTKEGDTGIMGKGPMIGISPVLSRPLFERLQEVAKKEEIPYQLEVMGSATGTNADVIEISGNGVAVATISLPLRYMHTAVEVIRKDDFEQTCALLLAYLRQRGARFDD